MSAVDPERQILYGLIAIQLKLVTLAHATRALAKWSAARELTLRQILVDQQLLDHAGAELVESVVSHRISLAGGDASQSLAMFVGSDALEALRGVLDQTLRPATPPEPTIAKIAPSASSSGASGNGWSEAAAGATEGHGDRIDESQHTFTVGGVLADQTGFEIVRSLARGGLGEVYVARDGRLNREVALKLIQQSQAGDPQSKARFLIEAEITGGLEHPGIVPVYALGENSDGRPFYAMRLVRGETLKARIRKVHRGGPRHGRPRELRQLLNHFVRLCDIVAYAHSRGVLHRDIKPSNVMLGKFGETLLVDWGLAKSIERTPEEQAEELREATLRPVSGSSVQGTLAGSALGTPQYMSPEQAMGQLDRLGPASDVYGLGATLYCIVTGVPPLAGITDVGEILRRVALGDIPPCRAVRPSAPSTLEGICKKAMAVQPEDRYSSALELSSDVESWLADEPVAGIREPLSQRLGRWERRHRTLLRIGALALLAVALVATAALVGVNRARQRAEERRREAITLGQIAETRKQESDLQRGALQRITSRLTFDRGLSLAKSGDRRAGLLWLARSLESVTDPDDPLQPAIRANLAGWSAMVDRLRDCVVHQGPVHAVAWSPTGRSVASGSDDCVVHLRDPVAFQAVCPPLVHAGPVRSVAYTHDGKILATASDDGAARLWNATSGLPRGEPLKHGGPVSSVAIAPDDATLVTASSDGLVRFWDVGTGQPRGRPLEHGKPLKSVLVAPDGKSIASIDEKGGALIWDIMTAKPRARLLNLPGTVWSLAFSPDGSKVVYGGDDRLPRLLDAFTGTVISSPSKSVHGSPILAVAYSHDGTKVATGSYDTACCVWKVPELTPLSPTMKQRGHVWAIAFSPDDSMLAAAADDNTAQLWDLATYRAANDPIPHQKPVHALAFSPDGRSILTGADDGAARVWQLGSDGGIGQPMKHSGQVRELVARPDGKVIATLSADGVVWLWDAVTTREIAHAAAHAPGPNFDLAFNPSGTVLVSCAIDGNIRLWNGVSLAPIGSPIRMTSWVRRVAISPDGAILAACDHAQRLGFWDLRTAKALVPLVALPRVATMLAFNSDSTRLAVGGTDGEVEMWDTARFRVVGAPMRHSGSIRSMAFSPDGSLLATASSDKTARLWNAQTSEPIGLPMQHRAYVWSVRFSPDGRHVLTGSFDGTARIWDSRTGSPLGEAMDLGDMIYDAIYNADASLVLTYGRSGVAQLWDPATARPVGNGFDCGEEIDAGAFLAGRPVIAVASRDGFARLWSVPTPLTGDPAHVAEQMTVITGTSLGDHDVVRLLDVSEWKSHRDALESQVKRASR
jgi:WD40 repeat protein/serine/threonine protein kinase